VFLLKLNKEAKLIVLGGLIMRVNSFYSIREDLKVYHNNNKCTEGNNIEPKNFKHGTAGRRLCERCKKLNREGK
jgi:hypothetical protein